MVSKKGIADQLQGLSERFAQPASRDSLGCAEAGPIVEFVQPHPEQQRGRRSWFDAKPPRPGRERESRQIRHQRRFGLLASVTAGTGNFQLLQGPKAFFSRIAEFPIPRYTILYHPLLGGAPARYMDSYRHCL